jgi:hypothetical protein
VSRPKVDPVIVMRLQELGLKLWSPHQPSYLFPKDGRKLTQCAVPSDPWTVTLVRGDRGILDEGSRIGQGSGATLDDAILAAIPTGLLASTMKLGVQLDKLAEAIRASQD